jgi:soluble lytic murein transglycosylase
MNKLFAFVILALLIWVLFYFEKNIELFTETPYEDYIIKYSNRFGVDSLLVKVVMKKESNLNPDAVSDKGAVGLMQIMPKTASEIAKQLNIKDYSYKRLREAEINIMFGTYYLQKLLNYYNNNLVLALAAYNAGIGNVENWRGKNPKLRGRIREIPFRETRFYVQSLVFTYKVVKVLYAFKKGLCISRGAELA